MSAASTSPVRRVLSAFFFALAVALLWLSLTVDGHAQSKPVQKPRDPEPQSQAVHYPDLCDVVEPGSPQWYVLLCFLGK